MTALYTSRTKADQATERLKAFAQPQRLMILSLLLNGERSVTEIKSATGIAQPTLSQQLAELRRAELVKTRREAKQIFYRLADEETRLYVRSIEAIFGSGQSVANSLSNVVNSEPAPPQKSVRRQAGAAVFAKVG